MDAQPEPSAEEIKRLQRCINDLVSVLALPAIWRGRDASQILRTLLDVLLVLLRLDFVYVRLKDPFGAGAIEMVRVAEGRKLTARPEEIGAALDRSLGLDPQKWAPLAQCRIGDEDLSVVPLRLALQNEIGVVVAGSERADFPGQTESLVLSVAANQAAIGLQEAHLLGEQKRIADELDQRVAQRTAELSTASDKLKNEVAERRRAEDDLHVTETNFSKFVESFPGLLVTMSLAGEVELFNREVLEFFGKTPEELRGWTTSDAVHPDDLPRVAVAFTNAIATATPYTIEHRCRRADGVYRWFHVRALPVQDEDGRVTGWYVLLTDIDDLKRAEASIRASERNLYQIINTIPALAWSARPDGSAEFFNQHYLDYVGLALEQVRDWGWTVAVHPDDLNSLIGALQRLMASDQPGECEARLRRFDGEYRWFLLRINSLRDESGNIIKWYGTKTDIDDRKRAEEELQRSEAFLAEGQRLSLTGTFSWRVAADEITWSEQVYRTFGFDKDVPVTLELIGSRVHPDDLPLFADMLERAQRAASDFEYEHRLLMPDQSIKYLHVIAHAHRDSEGRLEYIGAVQDVTERLRSAEALSNARSELAHMARITSLGVLTASIAHEVSQPLSGIITNASTSLRMLAADPPNIDGARETARRTIRDGKRASAVIDRLRALFAKKAATTESVDLNEVTREVIALSLSELQRNRVILRMELANDLPSITGDRIQLQQVILNLLLNASDAMSGVDNRPKDLVLRTEWEKGDRVVLAVHDAGVGIEPDVMDKLFEPFYTTKNQGMGIGLSVSRAIVESHHGRLWAARNDGPGATFSFSIPLDPEGAMDATPA
jgi:PAS domain S-box-containing protein